jgi:hypothetical protein
MIPVGYMYKSVAAPPDQLTANNVVDVCSVGQCGGSTTKNFADYISFLKHNGYWFFNSPRIIEQIAQENQIDLSAMTLFYYEAYEREFDIAGWSNFPSCADWPTDVVIPRNKTLIGYDVTEFVMRNAPECSLLSCSNLAADFSVNSHCLFDTFAQAKSAVESGAFHAHEPGPYRIIAVYLTGGD